MAFTLDGSNVLVTGGTGSFGTAFVERLLKTTNVARLVVYSRDEVKQQEMRERLSDPRLRFFIGDIRDRERLSRALSGVKVVVHTAALKQVPTAEYNPIECIKTNIMGAENVVNAAIDHGVSRVIALSSDKAANPINLYGATKLCSDKLFVAANHLAGAKPPRFSVVRYGNVIGSRGSVVTIFRRMAKNGAPLPITDERMTRFWITLGQGVDFVLKCLHVMAGGEIFVPKIPSMKVVDVAKAVAPDAKLDVVGMRPGEKLHEMMITRDDAINTIEFDDYYIILPVQQWWDGLPTDGQWFGVGRPVPEGFEYSSDRNDRWLDNEAFRKLMEEPYA